MKLSYNWLKQYITADLTPEQIAGILTDIGLEVESVEAHETIKGGLKKYVVGEVKECAKHPNADKLHVTKVDIGTGTLLDIVCGAPNVAAGLKVVVATEGAVVYKGDTSFEIKKTKLRGEPSEGMLCGADEIGVDGDSSGLLLLPKDIKAGTPAHEYFGVETDYILEIGLTPNHVDAASHYGVARDLAAYLAVHKQAYTLTKPTVDTFTTDTKACPVTITIENTEGCLRYAGAAVTGITVAPSPEWLQKRLKAIGLNPINNIVDITNFVLHETGQPLHAFDMDNLNGKQIIVKNTPKGTKFKTLDGIERELSAEDMMICDGKEPVAMAGVFGGLQSGITEKTKNIFIESAYFNPVSIRRTAKRHGLSTDSSFRFERGADPNNTVYALKRAAMLIAEIAGGSISEVSDVYPKQVDDFKVQVSYKHITRLIGKEIPVDTIKTILKALEIKIVNETNDTLDLLVPPYRVDVQREADVIEDILRLYGFNNVEISSGVKSTITHAAKPDNDKLVNTVSDMLAAQGFNEIMCNSLTKAQYYETLTSFPKENAVRILNPLSADLNVMRQTLLFGGLETILLNSNHQNPDLKLFEFGNCYEYNAAAHTAKDPLKKYQEAMHLALFLTGQKQQQNWSAKDEPVSFFQMKAYIENMLKRLGITAYKIEETQGEIFAQALQYSFNNTVICTYGSVNENVLKSFDIKKEVFYADINWTALLRSVKCGSTVYTELPKFPEVRRDLALLVNKKVTFEQIHNAARKTEKQLIKDLWLFDIYEGEKIGADKKSYAVAILLQDTTKTLTDSEIDKTMEKIQGALAKELGAALR